jgi:hypothetical protein
MTMQIMIILGCEHSFTSRDALAIVARCVFLLAVAYVLSLFHSRPLIAVGVVGGRAIASALRRNGALKSIDLWGSALGADGVGAIARALEVRSCEIRLVLPLHHAQRDACIMIIVHPPHQGSARVVETRAYAYITTAVLTHPPLDHRGILLSKNCGCVRTTQAPPPTCVLRMSVQRLN